MLAGEVDVRTVTRATSCDVAQARGRFGSRCLARSWRLAGRRIRNIASASLVASVDIGGGRIRICSALATPDEPDGWVPVDAGDGHAIDFHTVETAEPSRGIVCVPKLKNGRTESCESAHASVCATK